MSSLNQENNTNKRRYRVSRSLSESMPLTTEEPHRQDWLIDQLKDINEVDSVDTEENSKSLGQQQQQQRQQQQKEKEKGDNSSNNKTDDSGDSKTDSSDHRKEDDTSSSEENVEMENDINANDEEEATSEPVVVTSAPASSSTLASLSPFSKPPPSLMPYSPKATTVTFSDQVLADTSIRHTTKDKEKENQRKEERSPSSSSTYLRQGSSQLDLLWNEMERRQMKNDDYWNDNDSDNESDLDDELMRITEANRHISYEDTSTVLTKKEDTSGKEATGTTSRARSKSIHDPSLRELLVFSDPSTHVVVQQADRKVITMVYGAGPLGNQIRKGDSDIVTVENNNNIDQDQDEDDRYRRQYLVACDFSHESLHAMEWAMGTMLRDHDELHIVTVANREDNPDIVSQSGLTTEKEIETSLSAVVDEAKKRLSRMMLYDIKLVFYSVVGRVKDVLKALIRELSLTMVVCGSRGRGTMKGLLMGSVSTYLVHKSKTPVAVIRSQKKKKKEARHVITATPLRESVKTGHLHVDELT